MNQFTEIYKLKSNSDLIRIIKNPTEYQELALEAAKEELFERGVTEKDINEAEIVDIKKEEVDYIITPIFKRINLYFGSNTTEDNIILSLSVLLGLWSIIGLLQSWGLFKYALSDISNIDFSIFIFLLIMIIPPMATVLFWKRKKIGWILLAILLTYSMLESIIKFLNAYLYDKPDIIINFGIAIVFGLLLYLVCKPKIREIYRVNNKIMIHAIGWTFCYILVLYIYMIR